MESITLSIDEYKRLLMASGADDTIVLCEVCGAWMGMEEPVYCTAEDFTGCWKMATGAEDGLCVSHRAVE